MSALEHLLRQVATEHWRESMGMTYGSPDRCACGVETRPEKGDADVTIRRAAAFAAHVASEQIRALHDVGRAGMDDGTPD